MNNMKIAGVNYIKGVDGGPRVCIMGGLHGDEKVGVEVVKRLFDELVALDIFGEVVLVIGNPLACDKNVRFVDVDLNRLFKEGSDFKNLGYGVEQKRAEELSDILSGVDYLLDLHSTIKKSTPFIYCELDKEHLDIASLMSCEYSVCANKNFRPVDLVCSADNFVDRNGGIGITYESGWHEDLSKVDNTFLCVKRVLQKLKVYDFGLDIDEVANLKELEIYDKVVCGSDKFSFNEDYSNFDFVPAGTVLASDNCETIVAEKDSFIIFPKKDISKGKVALYLAQKL